VENVVWEEAEAIAVLELTLSFNKLPLLNNNYPQFTYMVFQNDI